METLNCKKDMDATMQRVHAHLELERALAVEISKSDNPWKYFTIIHKKNKIELAPQCIFS